MKAPFILRFHAKVDRSGGPDACWPWIGLSRDSYGSIAVPGVGVQASHRLALHLAVGAAPEGKPWALHKCDVKRCCNPAHLYWGTSSDNAMDRTYPGRHRKPIVLTDSEAA